jgi:hypothetical protein
VSRLQFYMLGRTCWAFIHGSDTLTDHRRLRRAEHLNRNIVQFDPAPRHQHGVEAKPKTKALPDYFL